MKVSRRLAGDLSRLEPVDGGDLVDDRRQKRRLVALSTVRHGRQKRTIGLDEEAVGRDRPGDLAQRLRLGERHDARQGDVQTEVESRACQRHRTGEAMQHAAEPALTFLSQHRERVVIGLSSVNDDGQRKLEGKTHLRPEHGRLDVPRREIVVVVEADLPDRPSARGPGALFSDDRRGTLRIVGEVVSRMRVDPTANRTSGHNAANRSAC